MSVEKVNSSANQVDMLRGKKQEEIKEVLLKDQEKRNNVINDARNLQQESIFNLLRKECKETFPAKF